MPKRYTKTEVQKMLVEERKQMRTKAQHALFMSRTLRMYNGQVRRFEEVTHQAKDYFPYTVEDLRAECLRALEAELCPHCDCKLTIRTMCADHRHPVALSGTFKLTNIRIICATCNFRKGKLSEDEFKLLTEFANDWLSADARADLWRRLVVGGKWAPR